MLTAWNLTPLLFPGRPRSCKATLICHSDPHLPFVPSPVMHFVLRTLAPFAFRQMQKVGPALLACDPCVVPCLARPLAQAAQHRGSLGGACWTCGTLACGWIWICASRCGHEPWPKGSRLAASALEQWGSGAPGPCAPFCTFRLRGASRLRQGLSAQACCRRCRRASTWWIQQIFSDLTAVSSHLTQLPSFESWPATSRSMQRLRAQAWRRCCRRPSTARTRCTCSACGRSSPSTTTSAPASACMWGACTGRTASPQTWSSSAPSTAAAKLCRRRGLSCPGCEAPRGMV